MPYPKTINKLISILRNQELIIQKIAQAQDQNIKYLKRTADIAALNLNAGLPIHTQVEVNPNQTGSDPNVKLQSGYTITVSGLKDNKMKEQFKTNLNNTLRAQKPELLNLITILYQ